MRAVSRPVAGLTGAISAPGDKSCSHRALMLAAMAPGRSRVVGLLEADDIAATARAMAAFGAELEHESPGVWRVHGRASFVSPAAPLDMGNSGTGARLAMGLAAGRGVTCELIGDASLTKRPMSRVLEPLAAMGAHCESADGRLPVRIVAGRPLIGVDHAPPEASAQVKSALLLAGLGASGRTRVEEVRPTRAHTEKMLPLFGVEVECRGGDRPCVSLAGGQTPASADITVPGDPSSAAFLWGAALVCPGSNVELQRVMSAPERDGLVAAATGMGARIAIEETGAACGEICVSLASRASALHGFDPPAGNAASMIDEYPMFAVLAAFAAGDSHVRGAGELRHKESDRIGAVVAMLRANGVEAAETADGFDVGGANGAPPGGGEVEARGDHRIAMAALAMGCAAQRPVAVDDVSAVATSYPGFFDDMRRLGADIEVAAC